MAIGELIVDSNHLDWLVQPGWVTGPPFNGAEGLMMFHEGDYVVLHGGRFAITEWNRSTGEKITETVTLAKGEFKKIVTPANNVYVILEEQPERIWNYDSLVFKKSYLRSLYLPTWLIAAVGGLTLGMIAKKRK